MKTKTGNESAQEKDQDQEGKAQEKQTQEEKIKFDFDKFRRRMRMILAYKDMQQKVLADKADIPVKRIGSYLQGIAQPPFAAVVAIANALEVSIDYLAGRTDKIDGFALEETDNDEELLSTIRLIRRAYKDSTEREKKIIIQLAKCLATEAKQDVTEKKEEGE